MEGKERGDEKESETAEGQPTKTCQGSAKTFHPGGSGKARGLGL